MKKSILYAPSIHVGGGFVLLKALLQSGGSHIPQVAFLNSRIRNKIDVPNTVTVHWISNNIFGRLLAQIQLYSCVEKVSDILFFHGIPPFLPIRGRVIVFFQNRLHFERKSFFDYGAKVAIRLLFERILINIFHKRAQKYIVQTASMKQAVLSSMKNIKSSDILVVPFVSNELLQISNCGRGSADYDFIYPADGMPHKNHLNLLEAWKILSERGVFPILVLTVPLEYGDLCSKIINYSGMYGLKIVNKGRMSHEQTLECMTKSRSLIFPSTLESFGLPLVEATQLKIPIVASELDFVRDVCVPVETFNPNSANSIASAVDRYLFCKQANSEFIGPDEFIHIAFD